MTWSCLSVRKKVGTLAVEYDVVAVRKGKMIETTLMIYRGADLCGEVIFETFDPMNPKVIEEYVKTITKISERRDSENKRAQECDS